jgi:hypothetical protein
MQQLGEAPHGRCNDSQAAAERFEDHEWLCFVHVRAEKEEDVLLEKNSLHLVGLKWAEIANRWAWPGLENSLLARIIARAQEG